MELAGYVGREPLRSEAHRASLCLAEVTV